LIERVLGIPSMIIGKSVSQVFFQAAVEEKNILNSIHETFKSTLKKLIFISLMIFVPLFFVIEDLFALVFGSEWREAGVYAKILLPVFFFNFVYNPFSVLFIVFEMQRVQFLINLFYVFVLIGMFLVVSYCKLGFDWFLYLFVIVSMVFVFLKFFILLRKLKQENV